MNGKRKTLSGDKRLFLIFLLTGICSVAVADIHYFVQMTVHASENELTIKTDRNSAGGCRIGREKGCVRAKQGERDIKLSFLLAGNTKCNLTNGVDWKLKDVTLGGKNSSSKPSSWGGFGTDGDVKGDFDFQDADTGVLNPYTTPSDRQITILDKNKNAYFLYYKVTAECLDGSGNVLKTITTDPRVINEG